MMIMMYRMVIFICTNLAVLFLFGCVGYFLEPWLPRGMTNFSSGITILLWCGLLGFGGSFLSLFLSRYLSLKAVNARIVKTPQTPAEVFLMETLTRLSAQVGIKPPQLAVFPSAQMNAFASGAMKNRSVVAVSTGLLENMDAHQIEAVLAHEIAHIANGDMVTMALIQGVVNTFVLLFARLLSNLVARVLSLNTYQGVYTVVFLLFQFVFGGLASFIVMWFSRRREYRADTGAANLVGKEKMISALEALQNAQSSLPANMRAMGIVGLRRLLLSSHPPVKKRIRRLQEKHS